MNLVRRSATAAIMTLALAFAIAAPAYAHGPQPLPEAACNHGTANAHGSIPGHAAGHDHVPHDHGDGCVHVNPTASH